MKEWFSSTARPWLVAQYEETKFQLFENIRNNMVATGLIAGVFVLGVFVGSRF